MTFFVLYYITSHFAVPNSDGYHTIQFDWNAATADTAFNFLSSKVLGTLKRKGMSCYMRNALKSLMKSIGDPKNVDAVYFSALCGAGDTKAFNNSASNVVLKRHFESAFQKHRADLAKAMTTYVVSHPVKLYAQDPYRLPQDLLPSHSEVNALARMVVLMSEPEVQSMWQEVVNESRSRESIDNAAASHRARTDAIETRLLDEYFNCVAYTAPNAVNLSNFKGAHLIPCTSHLTV
jgi:hypothetical protein